MVVKTRNLPMRKADAAEKWNSVMRRMANANEITEADKKELYAAGRALRYPCPKVQAIINDIILTSYHRSAKNGYIGKHKVEDWVHAKFRDAARDLATLDGNDLKRGFAQYVDEISDWSGIAKKEITHNLHMAMTEILGEKKRRASTRRNPADLYEAKFENGEWSAFYADSLEDAKGFAAENDGDTSTVRKVRVVRSKGKSKPRTVKRNPWFNVEIITPDHTIREQLMSGTRAQVRKRVREEYGERAQILGFKVVKNPEKSERGTIRNWEVIFSDKHSTQALGVLFIPATTKTKASIRAKEILRAKGYSPTRVSQFHYALTDISSFAKPNPEIDFDGDTFNRDKLDQLSATFQGEISGDEIEVDASEMVPNRTARLGALKLIKIVDESGEPYDIQFKNGAWLTADARKNLFCVGKGARINGIQLPKKGELSILGDITQIDYQTTKRHIENGKETYFYHKTGEVDSQKPKLLIDHNGYPHIYSGNYDIGIHGIEN